MKILLAASEFEPLTGEGVIGRSVAVLARDLMGAGHEVSVVIPGYRQARSLARARKTRVKFPVGVGGLRCVCEIAEGILETGLQIFFTVRDEFFDRSGIYGNESGDYEDNAARFIFFCKSVVELARRMEPTPEVVHSHGWQAALVPVFAREAGLPAGMVLNPQGLEFQGNFWSYDFGLTNLPGSYFSASGLEFYGSMNFLKGGILFADAVVMRGDRDVAAVQTSRYGCGLENVLASNNGKMWGIPSGEEIEGWEPAMDGSLARPFSPGDSANRSANRADEIFGWTAEKGGPDILIIAEASSGGNSLIFEAMDLVRLFGARVGILGKWDVRPGMVAAQRKHAGSFSIVEDFDEGVARRSLAGADILLVPGEAAPHSPWLSRALRYGAVPVARFCEGIQQWVRMWDGRQGTGFLFFEDSAKALTDIVRAAWETLGHAGDELRGHMAALSDELGNSAEIYTALYSEVVSRR